VSEVQNAIGVQQGIKLFADGAAPRIAQIDGKISAEHGVKGTAFQFEQGRGCRSLAQVNTGTRFRIDADVVGKHCHKPLCPVRNLTARCHATKVACPRACQRIRVWVDGQDVNVIRMNSGSKRRSSNREWLRTRGARY
jgi:hypothetical protein